MSNITGTDVQNSVSHWLKSPVNGYLGSGYGQDTKAMLQQPQSLGQADAYIAKLRSDVPALDILPQDAVNLYGVHSNIDRMEIVLEVLGSAFELG